MTWFLFLLVCSFEASWDQWIILFDVESNSVLYRWLYAVVNGKPIIDMMKFEVIMWRFFFLSSLFYLKKWFTDSYTNTRIYCQALSTSSTLGIYFMTYLPARFTSSLTQNYLPVYSHSKWTCCMHLPRDIERPTPDTGRREEEISQGRSCQVEVGRIREPKKVLLGYPNFAISRIWQNIDRAFALS